MTAGDPSRPNDTRPRPRQSAPPPAPADAVTRLEAALAEERAARERAEAEVKYAHALVDAGLALAETPSVEEGLRHLTHALVPAVAELCLVDLAEAGAPPRPIAAVLPGSAPNDAWDRLLREAPEPRPAVSQPSLHDVPAHAGGRAALLRELGIGQVLVVPLVVGEAPLGQVILGYKRVEDAAQGGPDDAHRQQALAFGAGLARCCAAALAQRPSAQALDEHLLRALRLETAGKLAGDVAHDFNNLLAPLTGYPELIKLQLPPEHPALAFCDAMLDSARQMVAVNQDLLTLGRRTRIILEPVAVNPVVREAAAQLHDVPETLRVTLELSSDLPAVDGASPQLLRALTNLVINAREAMRDDGTLTLATARVTLDEAHEGYTRVPPGDYVAVRVQDTGPGIPDTIRERIFDVFFTTKGAQRRRGSGLGLSVVQAIVADHRGFVDVQTQVPGGTAVTLYLPVSAAAVEAAADAEPEEVPRGSETILVVDDDARQREVAHALLTALGYQVQVVDSGEEAMRVLRGTPGEEPPKVDLLVLDMIMAPGIDGAETYRRVLEFRPQQRALIVSGFSPSSRTQEAERLGATTFLRKPVTLESLGRAVREALDLPRTE